jgi:hypothetical protein
MRACRYYFDDPFNTGLKIALAVIVSRPQRESFGAAPLSATIFYREANIARRARRELAAFGKN